MTALLIKESVNQTVDNMGFYNALQACFTLHQLNHAHWAEVHENRYPAAMVEDGVADWRQPASGAALGDRRRRGTLDQAPEGLAPPRSGGARRGDAGRERTGPSVYVADFAESAPDRAAVVMGGSGRRISYRELDEASIRFARVLRDRGLRRGDHFAVLLENHPSYFESSGPACARVSTSPR